MKIESLIRITLILGVAVTPALAGTISVNGGCIAGSCANPDVLEYGANSSAPFSFVYAFPNSDRYQMTGTFAASNELSPTNGGFIEITAADITVSYLGNDAGTGTSTDVMTVNFSQLFQFPSRGSNNSGVESIGGTFGGPLANASSVTGRAASAGTSMSILGPFFPSGDFYSSLASQPFSATVPNTPLSFADTLTFGAGSQIGATIFVSNTPEIPEPASWSLMALALMGVGIRARLK